MMPSVLSAGRIGHSVRARWARAHWLARATDRVHKGYIVVVDDLTLHADSHATTIRTIRCCSDDIAGLCFLFTGPPSFPHAECRIVPLVSG